ncbi:MAG: hypothetical protein ACFFDF_24535 [Candidatus Odinarchaeota archaeon]
MAKGELDLEFKTEVVFKGSVEEFQEFAVNLVKLPVKLKYDRIWRLWKKAGSMPVPMELILRSDELRNLVQAEKRFKLIKDIDGGIRNAHFHIDDEIVLIDRDVFEKFTEKVAERMIR